MSEVVIHTDGGSRGNPGPSAIGVVIDLGVRGVKEYGESIGRRTNNEAEYEAVIFALKKTKVLLGSLKSSKTGIMVCMDSELIVKQLCGEYKIKEKEFYPLFIAVWNAQQDFHEVRFKAVPREQNTRADSIVNRTLDQNTRKQLAF
ncbi:MAG: Ribonuclease H [Parcubacteria group bacterium GW2011_GWB1_46_8]|nr:MAG: Ribonuclease H [Parcubacteria group bacterium GW2011_GWF1_45_5]KKU43559.1 MAG: Ribonuclease H [Parcubacteria group bacterium GW2011_GWA2_46_7]KKU46645.1 MAG: Ribonuclease H [Parcubacteria group bacterium GW2011_GWB1_46_8]KKU47789.1 MAG: Ribonuclease H [Parcubacteria group bacterium GW2011_GWF2_46_8]